MAESKVTFPSDELIQRVHDDIIGRMVRVHKEGATDIECIQCELSDGLAASEPMKAIILKAIQSMSPIGSAIDPAGSVKIFAFAFNLGLQVGRADARESAAASELENLVSPSPKVN